MIMGTHSNAGKSTLVTALCRIFARQGYRVAPFKAQNMALNAGVTPEGHEIGRATIAQAEAAGLAAHVDMNPILLKPAGNSRSQIVLNGRPFGHIQAKNWHSIKPTLWEHVTTALARLRSRTDLVLIEGAGSPAEINLKQSDIVNMRVARHVQAPVLLVGDIDRGGVFAALVGTLVLLEPAERGLVKGFVINKFRGDISLLGDGLSLLQERAYNTPTVGVIPFLFNIGLAAEDSVALEAQPHQAATAEKINHSLIDIAVIRLPHIANFDDFDPLAAEAGVQVRYVSRVEEFGQPAAIILPGTKTTLDDLAWLYSTGLDQVILTQVKQGKPVVGICGGYQILGQSLTDPDGVEAQPGTSANGLGLLPLQTTFVDDKRTRPVQAILQAQHGPLTTLTGTSIQGYEIHMGRSVITNAENSPLCFVNLVTSESNEAIYPDGLISADGHIWGTYLHGLFDNDALRHTWLHSLGWRGQGQVFDRQVAYNRLADHVEAHLDMKQIQSIINT